MEYRMLGKTGLSVSRMGFGAIKLPNISYETADSCLNRALDLGVNFVDTARAYKDSEEKIGRALEHRRSEYYLASKSKAKDYDEMARDIEESLRMLRTDYVDLWQLHSISNIKSWTRIRERNGALRAVFEARDQGMVRHIGITIHRDHNVVREAVDSGLFETIMLAYNPVDSEAMEKMIAYAKKSGMGVIIMKALSGGQIAYPPEARKAGFGGQDALVAGALRWVLSNKNVDCVIPGIHEVWELEENLKLVKPFRPLEKDEKEEFIKILGKSAGIFKYKQRCLRCGYCQPCPQGIQISEVFRARQMFENYPENLRHKGTNLYASLEPNAEACVECGECLERCPAGLDIPRMLREAHEKLD